MDTVTSRRAFIYCSTLLIIFIGVLRFLLLGKGALAEWDEVRYLILANSLGLLDGNTADTSLSKVIEGITAGSLGRPGVFIFWTPAILLQSFTAPRDWGMLHPQSMYIPQLFSWLYSIIGITLFACLIGILCEGRYWWAFLALCMYGFLSNSTFYVRAINPYDPSLCCFLAVSLLLLRAALTTGNVIFAGSLSSLGFLTYPGYYWCFILACFLLLRRLPRSEWQKNLGLFTCGASLLPALIEIVSSGAGHSYSSVLRYLVPTVSRGDSAETLLFPLKYLLHVEGLAGIALIAVILYIGVNALIKREPRSTLAFEIVSLTLLCILLHGASGTIFGAPVFYGRLLHSYIPFCCIAIVLLGDVVRTTFARSAVSLLTVTVIGLHGYNVFSQLWAVQYPRDRFFELLAQDTNWEFARRVDSSDRCSPVTVRPSFSALTFPEVEERSQNLTLVNFCDFYEISDSYQQFVAPNISSKKTKDLGLHFINFPAYTFEGYGPEERARLPGRSYRLYAVVDHANQMLKQ